MWDEEGLEPLGGAVTTNSINTNSNTTHHIGSFDSDLNSLVSLPTNSERSLKQVVCFSPGSVGAFQERVT